MTVAQSLQEAARLGLARLDAQRLLLHALGREPEDRAWLLAHDTDAVPQVCAALFESLCRRSANGEPLAYLLGHQSFFGLDLQIDHRVLVPRPDTETLVEWALEKLGPGARVLDLGTGSGAIALALKQTRPDARVDAVDASADALQVARINARRLGLEVHWRQAQWLDGADLGYDLIVSNPPYIALGDVHLPALAHEPLSALVAGADGLADLRQIAAAAPSHLRSGGWLLLEHGWNQAAAVRELLQAAKFSAVASRRDLAGIERCSGGQWLELG
jgi:release factor glutamine methyltransferase